MKKAAIASLLSVAALSLCVTTAVAQNPGQVTIKDQAEYNAFTNAESQTTPAMKASAIEGFLQTYPNSVVKDDLLGQLMTAYTQVPDIPKAVDAADRLLKDDPNNLRALTIEVYLKKAQADQTTDPAAKQALLDDAAARAQRGLNVTKPIGTPQADFDKLKVGASPYFYGAIATDAEGKKDYPTAVSNYLLELKNMAPADTQVPGPVLQDTFNMALDFYKETPPDFLNCAFFAARAANFAPEPYKSQMLPTATFCFKKYIGPSPAAGQTFDQFQAVAAANVLPPAALSTQFKQYIAPKPEDLAHQAVTSTADLNTLAVQDKEFILGNGAQADADKVWAVMKDVTTEVPGTVVTATAEQIQLSVSEEAIQNKTADFTVNMKTPLKEVPATGASIKVIGTFDSFTKTPTMIILKDGELPAKPAPAKKAPAHPVHHTAH
jgi:hypothetical protein